MVSGKKEGDCFSVLSYSHLCFYLSHLGRTVHWLKPWIQCRTYNEILSSSSAVTFTIFNIYIYTFYISSCIHFCCVSLNRSCGVVLLLQSRRNTPHQHHKLLTNISVDNTNKLQQRSSRAKKIEKKDFDFHL